MMAFVASCSGIVLTANEDCADQRHHRGGRDARILHGLADLLDELAFQDVDHEHGFSPPRTALPWASVPEEEARQMAEAAEDQDETAGQDVDKTPCRRTGQRGRARVMTRPDASRALSVR